MTDDLTDDLRHLHSRITDIEHDVELHSADLAAIFECIRALSKRLSAVEKRLGVQGECDEAGST